MVRRKDSIPIALVVGAGHIGRKRVQLLLEEGFAVIVYDTNSEVLESIWKMRGALTAKKAALILVTSMADGLALKPDVCFICTPADQHLVPAIMAAKAGVHLFIEKPLSHCWDEKEFSCLIGAVQQNSVWVKMGFSYRHSKSLREFRNTFDYTKVVAADLWAGQYLPDWHPGEEYEFSSTAAMGVILESLSHSLDMVHWLFGEIKFATGVSGRTGLLNIDSVDTATMLLLTAGNAAITVHADFWQRDRHNRIIAVTAEHKQTNTYEWIFDPREQDAMLRSEILSVKKALEQNLCPQPDLYQGIKNIELLHAAMHSCSWAAVSAEAKRVMHWRNNQTPIRENS